MQGEGSPQSQPRRTALYLLYVVVTLNVLLTALVFSYVLVLKSAHDTEQQRIEQQIRLNDCALLDELPASLPPLQRLRATYHCGPGLPGLPTRP
jgi:flagellar basal body-associated protein FliL